VVEEFRIAGTASAYAPRDGSSEGPDGRWDAVEIGEATYRTRLLVVRPRDPAAFNGTVLLSWQNVSAGAEQPAPRRGEPYRGYAWVGVSAQEVGIHGFPMGMGSRFGGRVASLPLADHDPGRYGSLSHPGDQGSFDIFTQAARATRGERTEGPHPLGELRPSRVVALGGSQSAMRLATYANAVQPLEGALDGFLLSVWEGRGPGLLEGSISFGGHRSTIRGDLDVPVMVVNSEFEVLPLRGCGILDSPLVRVWEVAGAPHGVARAERESPSSSGWTTNELSIWPVHDAAIRRLHEWLSRASPAPAQPRILVERGTPPQIVRDELGNALGGIRLPEMAAPTAEHRGMSFGTGRAPLFGASRRFPDDVLRQLYPTRDDYIRRFEDAVDALVATSALLPEDSADMKAAAAHVELPVDR
jgi:hypothetical protein